MADFEVIARMKIRPGQLDGFKAQSAEMMRLTRERDTQTIRYDWFINEEAMECEVHEQYADEQGLIEHNTHILDARNLLFERYAYDHRMSAFAPISEELRDLGKKHAGGLAEFRFFQGLAQAMSV